MPVAIDRKDRMWTADNLNGLYARFDQKVARVFDGKTPFACGYGTGNIPSGVLYDYCVDPDTSFYITGQTASDTKIEIELSKLENKQIDPVAGEVFVDTYVASFDGTFCDVASIQKSFKLHKRNINGIDYDVHLGWDSPNTGLSSYVRQYFDDIGSVPTLPPGRIHKHKLAVAEIRIEGLTTFSILNSYQRYDCWRVHNFGRKSLEVRLQLPDGSAQREYIAAKGCRSFRRRSDGTWATTWPNGSACYYFFPYFTGDVPYFAGGPPMYGQLDSLAVCLERSAKANNVANPFILTQWMRALDSWVDGLLGLNLRQMYPEYADPTEANTIIGDCIFTWGRARVTVYNTTTNIVSQDYFKIFQSSASFVQNLEAVGVNVTINGTSLELSSKLPNTAIKIYPIDCNVFFTPNNPYWLITPTVGDFDVTYPLRYYTQDNSNPFAAKSWIGGNEPSWLENIRTLRRRIAVEEGFISNFDDVTDIPEEKVSLVSLTPLGLMCQAASSQDITVYDANAFSLIPDHERSANSMELRTTVREAGFGSGIYANSRYCSSNKTYLLTQPSNVSGWYGHVFPQISTDSNFPASKPAINCGYVPLGGPWGFSSSVFDPNLQRVLTTNPASPALTGVFGSDFWVNKWGGKAGVDASVRILGQPNKTVQSTGAVDDVFYDQNTAGMAALCPWVTQPPVSTSEQAEIAEIRFVADTYFEWPFIATNDTTRTAAGGGPFYHKIPKSAFLWNLLESQVRGWTRAVPRGLGNDNFPLFAFDAGGALQPTNFGDFYPRDLWVTSMTSEGPSLWLNPSQYDSLIANGIQAKKLYDPVTALDYYVVSAYELATYSTRQGFSAYNFDCNNQVLFGDETVDVAGTQFVPVRSYGTGDTTQMASYAAGGTQFFRAIRYIDLRLPNELGA